MSDVLDRPPEPMQPRGRRARALLTLWVLALLLLGLVTGFWAVSAAARSRADAITRHHERVDPFATESGRTGVQASRPPGHERDVPAEVRVGLYVDRIVELAPRETAWTADFYVWLTWTGDGLDPGRGFQVVDGAIESRELLKHKVYNGARHYVLYRVTARMTKFFNVSRFPCDDHLLTISLEDRGRQWYQLRYIAGAAGSAVSSRVQVPGYVIYDQTATVKLHSYKTRRGDPSLPRDAASAHSQFVFGIWIKRADYGFYFKMFQGLFAAVAIAMLGLFIKPIHVDPRFGLGVGAFFAAVADTYIVTGLLPESGTMTLADMVSGIGMGLIFLILLQSAISLYLFDHRGMEALSECFDRVSFYVLTALYVAINVAVPRAAML